MNGRGIEVRRETAEARLMDGRAFAAALVIFSLISGCGGDASSYTADGDAICARVVADSRALFRTTGSAPAARDRAFSRIVRARGAALAKLHQLAPPPDKRAKVERMLDHFDDSQRLLREAERSWGKSEQAPFLLVGAAREGDKGHAVARELGFDDCADF